MPAPPGKFCSWKRDDDDLSRSDSHWQRIGVVVLVVSLLLNLVLISLNKYQHDWLVQLSPGVEITGHLVDGAREVESSSLSAFDFSRHLGSSTTSGSSSGCGSSGGDHAAHNTDALLFLFNAFVIGAAVMQLSSYYPWMQQSVLLFVAGFVMSLFFKGLKLKEKVGIWGRSYDMWVGIDPHLLLFTMLPPLLAGDAMTIDTSVAKRVGFQCLYLAGPGVLICGFSTAAFLSWFLGWEFRLSLCAGAILCATDPVAVVALLKELGASPMLTVQIQGESLLNDGTAIVLYLISYNMLSGEDYDVAGVAEFLVKKAMMAWALGLFIGYIFFSWIRFASDKLSHSSSMIQITLTLCCAYWSFCWVEGVLTLSGVLATVASSLVLAHHMWPYVVSEESMRHVWHTFESLGNIIVFFLAGTITGSIVLDIDPIDFLNLFVIYVFLVFLRGALIFCSRPILKRLSEDGQEVTWQDAALMTWGGLRGAVGLALAIQVNNGRAAHIVTGEPMIAKKDAERLLFFVSGVAFLTTMINATTAPTLVKFLGITALPQARMTLLRMFNSQLIQWSQDSNHPEEVNRSLREMLMEADVSFSHTNSLKNGPKSTRSNLADRKVRRLPSFIAKGISGLENEQSACKTNSFIVSELRLAQEWYKAQPAAKCQLLGEPLQEDNMLCKVDDIIELIEEQWVDEGMSKVVNQIFLTLVLRSYWVFIEEGLLRPGSPEADALLSSVRVSLSYYRTDLLDYAYIEKTMVSGNDNPLINDEMEVDEKEVGIRGSLVSLGFVDTSILKRTSTSKGDLGVSGCLQRSIVSWQFGVAVPVVILLNTVQVLVEEIWRTPESAINDHIIWLLLDILFTLCFFIEFVLKFGCMGRSYFSSWWNRFDFFLVCVGVVGAFAAGLTHGKGSTLAGQTRMIRIARVLRTLRFLRIFRLFHAKVSKDKFVSPMVAKQMKKVVALDCFIRAHCKAQVDIVRYFAGNGKVDDAKESEIGRCVLQSQIAVFRALRAYVETQEQLGKVYEEIQNLHSRKAITVKLSNFCLSGLRDGALSATETHAIVHPMYHHIAECMKKLNDRTSGIMSHDHPSLSGAHGLALFQSLNGFTEVKVMSPESEDSGPQTFPGLSSPTPDGWTKAVSDTSPAPTEAASDSAKLPTFSDCWLEDA